MATPGDAALDQRTHHTYGAKHATHDVVDTGARPQRVARAPGHVGQAAHHLHHLIERGAVLIRAGQKAFEAGVNQARVVLAQAGMVQAIFGQGAGLEIFGHHIGAFTQAPRHCRALGLVQVDANAFFVAIEHRKKPRTRAQQMAGAVAVNGLHLDHLGTQISQHHATGGAHDHVGEFNHPQTTQGLVSSQWQAHGLVNTVSTPV